jgi:hypothetical protein
MMKPAKPTILELENFDNHFDSSALNPLQASGEVIA